MKFTVGPWKYNGYQSIIAPEKHGALVCGVYEDQKADAQLIAAAPEMLEALEHLLELVHYSIIENEMSLKVRNRIKNAKAIVKKAKGEL